MYALILNVGTNVYDIRSRTYSGKKRGKDLLPVPCQYYRADVFNGGGRPLLEPAKGCQGLPETSSMTNYDGPFRARDGLPRVVFRIGILH